MSARTSLLWLTISKRNKYDPPITYVNTIPLYIYVNTIHTYVFTYVIGSYLYVRRVDRIYIMYRGAWNFYRIIFEALLEPG